MNEMLRTRQEQELAYQLEVEEGMDRDARAAREELIRENYKYMTTIDLGRECTQFWESNVGRAILDKAIKDTEAAKRSLVELKRSDYETSFAFEAAVSELQSEALVPNMLWNWLNDAIRAADEAVDILSGEEDE
jgi:hypothetical protein